MLYTKNTALNKTGRIPGFKELQSRGADRLHNEKSKEPLQMASGDPKVNSLPWGHCSLCGQTRPI